MTTTAADATIPSTGSWRIDSVHSTAHFSLTHHRVATFRAGFRDIVGALREGVLSGSVQVESLDLPGPDMFKEHLMAADWFDAAHHTELSFGSTDLHTHGDSIHGAGELTIKGVTRSVELRGRVRGPVEVTLGDQTSQRLGLDLSTTVDRREFGIIGDGGAAPEVTLEVALELVKE